MRPTIALISLSLAPLVLAACGGVAPAVEGPAPSATDELFGSPGSGMVRLSPSSSAASMVVARSPGAAWSAVVEAYETLEIPVTTADPADGLVANPRARFSRRLGAHRVSVYFDCGQTALGHAAADRYVVTANVTTRVRAVGADSASVESTVSATAQNPASSSDPVRCLSRGTLERRVLELTYLHLGRS